MGWFSNLFKKAQIAGGIYEQMVLSDLAAVQGLPPSAQRTIAEEVSKFINMASIGGGALLEQFSLAATQERHQAISDGASSNHDPHWAAASLKEAWCMAKLGRKRGVISASVADMIIREIEGFVFNPRHV
jgi:hypothetical protein